MTEQTAVQAGLLATSIRDAKWALERAIQAKKQLLAVETAGWQSDLPASAKEVLSNVVKNISDTRLFPTSEQVALIDYLAEAVIKQMKANKIKLEKQLAAL